ncbi:histone-lysine N-methyltransferase SETMAR [Trichonephila clavipes]|nr:histone-lysine N-methyltransferase SETMAR [Trichonephila clavipes]
MVTYSYPGISSLRTRNPMRLKGRRVEELTHVKSLEASSPHVSEGMPHYDNVRPYFARCVQNVSQQNNVEILPHPPYSPDKIPCDFSLFSQLKKTLRDKRFANSSQSLSLNLMTSSESKVELGSSPPSESFSESSRNELAISSEIRPFLSHRFRASALHKLSSDLFSVFGLAIHQNDHQARRRFVEWAQNEIAVVPDFHKRILFSDEAHFWLNGYVNKQNCRIWSEANPQVYVETLLHPEKLTVWCALWAGGILLQNR